MDERERMRERLDHLMRLEWRFPKEDEMKDTKTGSVSAIVINFDFPSLIKEYGYLKAIWGYDIFLNGVPFLKTLVLLNIVANVAIWLLFT